MKLDRMTTLAVFVACASGTLAAQQQRGAASVAECAAIEAAAARLECFDALAAEERGASAAVPPAPSAPRPSQGAASSVPGDLPAEAARASRREARAADRAERELTSVVTGLREIQPGRIEVTLANGQVWRQTNTDPYNLVVGHEVVLYPTSFGRYFRLSSKTARGFIQVERVR